MTAVLAKSDKPRVALGRPKDADKRAAILRVARKMFFERGLEAVTIEAVAADAAVSRMTVYGHFGGKEALFSEVIAQEANKLVHSLSGLSCQHETLETYASLQGELVRFGTELLEFFIRPDVRAFHQLLQIEGPRYPKLVKAFVNLGPRAVVHRLGERMQEATSAGAIAVSDPIKAAQLLISLFRGIETASYTLGLSRPPSRREIERHVSDCVTLFLRAYSAPTD